MSTVMKEKPEILAPAGSYAGLQAAVAAGCDAVYIGGMQFGARAYADNPDTQTMIRAIEYCHLHGVKLYLTVNTLLKDQELQVSLYNYMKPFYEAGLDAVIVQDLGVVRALHRWFPDLDLHASTQMNLVMGKGMDRLKQYGITRIVPARELSLGELEQMRQDTDLELEVFVHGALCYCYSGRCLFSSMQGGRSGNRGRCTQPCRMLYHGQGQPGYYLSPKELCNLSYLPELICAGVNSFKIEGRMKRPEYAAFVTSLYRYYVDLYQELGQDGFHQWQQEHQEQWQDDRRKLAELYNREGFTSGYLQGKAGMGDNRKMESASMLAMKRSRHGGVKVGTVVSVDARSVVYRLEREIVAQDVVEFRDSAGKTIYEYTVGTGSRCGDQVLARYQRGCRIRVGDGVYRTRHQQLLDEIDRNYLGVEDSLPISGTFVAEEGKACTLTLSRLDCTINFSGDVVSPAMKQPATEESVRKALCQTGDSKFSFEDLEIVLRGSIFLPVGMLKKMRRAALQDLENALLSGSRRTALEKPESGDVIERMQINEKRAEDNTELMSITGETGSDDAKNTAQQNDIHTTGVVQGKEPVYSAAIMTWEQLQLVLSEKTVQELILRMDQMTDDELERAAVQVRDSGKRLVLGMPAIWRNQTWQRYAEQYDRQEGIFWKIHPDAYLIQNMESLSFLQEVVGASLSQIRTDASLYVMNREAEKWWQEQGIRQTTLPWELTGSEWQQSAHKELQQVIIYGHIPLMVSAQCLACNTGHCKRTEQDACRQLPFQGEKKRRFLAVNYCKYCYNIIYQGLPFSIQRETETLGQQGFCQQRYEFTVETAEQVRRILAGHVPEQIEIGHYEQDVY
ncbi:MAG: U32 family peptidase [Lachnospiraceae bacterium]|nr:U32 family peptidase [Lachnospiraceae bacterium]